MLFPAWEIPESGIRYVLYAAILGLPVALLFAWFFDVGASGIQRTAAADDAESQPLRARDFVLLTALLLVIGAIGYGTLKDVGQGAEDTTLENVDVIEAPVDGPPVVAVLPFAASGDTEDSTLFADGVHDDLLTQLSRLGSLRVISRTSVMSYRDVKRNIRQIGRELGATVVLEGFVRVVGDQLRINAQLIDARTDQHLWAETFDRSLSTTNLFEIQAEIARAISKALDTELSPAEERDLAIIPTSNMAAYRAFKRATGGTGRNLTKPEFLEDLEQAVALDPEFVRAWAEIAGGYATQSSKPDNDREEYLQRSEAALQRIAELAPNSVDHLYAQAYYLYYALSEYDDALALADRAIALKPSDVRLLQLKTWIQRRQGRFEERIEPLEQLVVLEPLNPERQASLIFNLFNIHRYDEAWAAYERAGPESLPARNLQARWIKGVLGNRNAPSFEIFMQRYTEAMEGAEPPPDPVLRWGLAWGNRDFELALSLVEEIQNPPGWEQMPLNAQGVFGMLTLWAMGDDLRLQSVVAEAQSRMETIAADNPQIVADDRFLQDTALLAFFRGDQSEAIALLERWERVTLNDWAQRIEFREAVCGSYGIMAMATEAVACLRRGFEEPSRLIPWMTPYMPEYDPVRESPEFQALLAELEAARSSEAEG